MMKKHSKPVPFQTLCIQPHMNKLFGIQFLFVLTQITVFSVAAFGQGAVKGPTGVPEVDQFFHRHVADGFDFPVGNVDGKGSYTSKTDGKTYNGWYIATHTAEEYSLGVHTGEDWNGNGGGNTDLDQPVYAIGKGLVLDADNFGAPWGNIVLIKHWYIENGTVQTIYSLYAHLEDILIVEGQVVNRRQKIGTIGTGDDSYLAHLHLEIRSEQMANYAVDYWPSSDGKDQQWVADHYLVPTDFINAHRQLTVPTTEPHFVLALKSNYTFYYFQSGQLVNSYDLALGQNPEGHKEEEGDNRTPEGAYRIIQKSRGPFEGSYGAFFGVAWMRLNYPNAYDAKAGLARGAISKAEHDQIVKAIAAKDEPPKNTQLGGGIGIHGWNGSWEANGHQDLTWGCISLNNTDLDVFYDQVPLQTPIFIVP